MHRAAVTLACTIALAGCAGSASEKPRSAAPRPAAAKQALAGSPAPLAELHRQANQLLGGGKSAFTARLAALRGYPVVVNKWASWCAPCRSEFPFFQRQALKRGKEIAFLGVDSNDNDGDARDFLREL